VSLNLDEVIPLGRCLGEYRKMFSLEPSDLKLAILDCAGGTASFNAEMTRLGNKVISCDPDYQFTAGEIRTHLPEYHTFINGFELSKDFHTWKYFDSPNHLGEVRRRATEEFLEDFPSGLEQGRYVNASLPDLSRFDNDQFDLALCSHFLFTYSDRFSENFHLQAITEMCRVAKEVRVFPLLDRFGGISEHLNPIRTILNRSFHVETPVVNYEFQIGGNEMLRVSKKSSA